MIPATITAIAVPLVSVVLARMNHKITAIDHAVNGQPPDTPPLVEKVGAIILEQVRVADELEETTTAGQPDRSSGGDARGSGPAGRYRRPITPPR